MKSIICYSLYAQKTTKEQKQANKKQSKSSPYSLINAKLKDHLRDKGHFDEDLLEALVA